MDETKKQPEEIAKSAEPTSPELSEATLEQVAGGAGGEQTDDQQDYYKLHISSGERQ
jgi:hypothetical protein